MKICRSGNLACGFLVIFSAIIALVGCSDGHLRGSALNHKTERHIYPVVDDNGGQCGPIIVDGKVWPHKIGEPGLISPGSHRIECGGWIEFEIPNGVIFSFDYWGP